MDDYIGGYDCRNAREELRKKLGEDQIQALNRNSQWKAWAVILSVLFLIMTNIFIITHAPLWLAIVACVFQGFFLQYPGYLMHEFGVHGGIQPKWLGEVVATFAGMLIFSSYTQFRIIHTLHHQHAGADWDEAYKQRLDSLKKRMFNLSLPGILYFNSQVKINPSAGEIRRIRWEKIGVAGFAMVIIGLASQYPESILLGYLLPLATVTPIASNVRLILEHSEMDTTNEFHNSIYYRTGPISRFLFLCDVGDCHIVHHIFPRVPSYHMAQAVKLIRPILVEKGIPEHVSVVLLFRRWFVDVVPHRTVWRKMR